LVTLREKIEYNGLYISVEPSISKPFYLTGDISSFNVIVENTTDLRRHGKLAL